jgi:hypothetical protein
MASPAASPVSFEASGVTGALSATHADLSKFNPLPTGGLLHNSLPPPPLPSLGRVLTPRTDPTGCEENGITLLANKYILLDQLEGSNLRRCIHVETHDQFVCKVRMVPFFLGGGGLRGFTSLVPKKKCHKNYPTYTCIRKTSF